MKVLFMILLFTATLFAANRDTINTSNNHWGKGGNVPSPVHIKSHMLVAPEVTLTIEPGTEVIFEGEYILRAEDKKSTIRAIGTVDKPIIFSAGESVTKCPVDVSYEGSATFIHTRFENVKVTNTDHRGELLFKNSIFTGNSFIRIVRGAPKIINNTFYFEGVPSKSMQVSFTGDTIYPIIKNNIFVNNTGGLWCYGVPSPMEFITYNSTVVFGDGTHIFKGCDSIGEGNFIGDPQFVNADQGNFHLKPTSPAIDAGDPTDDYSLEPQDGGERINLGAYGNTKEAALKSSSIKKSSTIQTLTYIQNKHYVSIYSPLGKRKLRSIQITNLLGKSVYQHKIKLKEKMIILQKKNLIPGIYFMKLVNAQSSTIHKIIVR